MDESQTSNTASQLARDPLSWLIAACAANGMAYIVNNTSPFIIGALVVGFPMNEEGAGLVLTIELLCMGVSALAISPFLSSVSRRLLAYIALTVIAVANASVVFGLLDGNYEALCVVRGAAGLGTGVVMAIANASIAESVLPTRLYGIALMVAWLVSAALGPVMARTIGSAGLHGAYGVWLVLALVAMPLVVGLRNRHSALSVAVTPGKFQMTGVVHLSGIVLVGVSMMAYFAFMERLAQHNGFTLEDVGLLFAASAFAGAIGAGFAGWMADKHGLIGPVIIGTLLHALTIMLAVWTSNSQLFVIGVMAEAMTFMYLLTYLFSLAATLDEYGRWAAAASGAMVFSTGLGPYVGGALITGSGYGAIGWLALVSMILALSFFAVVAGRLKTDELASA